MPFYFAIFSSGIRTFAGAFLAAIIAAKHKMEFTLVISLFFLAGGIAIIFMLSFSTWFTVLDLVGVYIPIAYLAGKLVAKNNKSDDCEGITASIETKISVQTDTINVTLPYFLAMGTAWMAPFPTAFIKKMPLEFVLPGSGNLSVFNHHVGIGITYSYNSITIHGFGLISGLWMLVIALFFPSAIQVHW